jgi:hypothetical protein
MFLIGIGLKQGDALSPLLFNFALAYTIRRVLVNQEGLKLNGKHELLVLLIINIVGENIHTVKKNAEALVVASNETGLKEMLMRPGIWSCLEIRMHNEVAI